MEGNYQLIESNTLTIGKKSLNWEPKTFDDFFSLMPEEYEPTVRTTTQAGMNISSGKLGIRRLVAGSELNHAIDG